MENDSSFPSQEVLAVMAAIVGRGRSADTASAVDYAYNLWVQAGERLNQEQQQAFSITGNLKLLEQEFEGLDRPEKYPATFNEFLKLIVCEKTQSGSNKRFREFLRSNHGVRTADTLMSRHRADGFADEALWFNTARDYRKWWSEQKSIKARLAARSRKSKN
jgi:hypothetical protein